MVQIGLSGTNRREPTNPHLGIFLSGGRIYHAGRTYSVDEALGYRGASDRSCSFRSSIFGRFPDEGSIFAVVPNSTGGLSVGLGGAGGGTQGAVSMFGCQFVRGDEHGQGNTDSFAAGKLKAR